MQSANDNQIHDFEGCLLLFNELAHNLDDEVTGIETSYFQELGHSFYGDEIVTMSNETIFAKFLLDTENLIHNIFEAEIVYALKLKTLISFFNDLKTIDNTKLDFIEQAITIIQKDLESTHKDVKEIYDGSQKAVQTTCTKHHDDIVDNYRSFYMNINPRPSVINLTSPANNITTLNSICFDLNTSSKSAFINQAELSLRYSGMLYKIEESKIAEDVQIQLNTGHIISFETLKSQSDKVNNRLLRTPMFLRDLGDNLSPIFPQNAHQFPFNKKLTR